MKKYFFNFTWGIRPKGKPEILFVREKAPWRAIRLFVELFSWIFIFEVVKNDHKTVFPPHNKNQVWKII